MHMKKWGGANSITCPPTQKSGVGATAPFCPPGSAVYGLDAHALRDIFFIITMKSAFK